jgi:hypothetical protein
LTWVPLGVQWGSFYGFFHIPFFEEMYLGIDVDMDVGLSVL